jgi:murein DD-endopeptidase MepM/ murein hydrolase activator NlpD
VKYIWPVAAPPKVRRNATSNTFGMVRKYADGRPKPHQGLDAHAHDGTSVLAVADGRVVGTADRGAYGKQLVLELAEPAAYGAKYAFYAHLSRFDVAVGDAVAQGQVLGASGSSGNAQGMGPDDQHLHFEARTVPWPGLGLEGRVSPLGAFGWKFSARTGAVTLE